MQEIRQIFCRISNGVIEFFILSVSGCAADTSHWGQEEAKKRQSLRFLPMAKTTSLYTREAKTAPLGFKGSWRAVGESEGMAALSSPPSAAAPPTPPLENKERLRRGLWGFSHASFSAGCARIRARAAPKRQAPRKRRPASASERRGPPYSRRTRRAYG